MNTMFQKSTGSFTLAVRLLAAFGLLALASAQEKPEVAPHLVATSPAVGDTEVSPLLKEITVTFDCDMDEGMSWTGGGASFPKSPDGGKAHWRDKRTCVLPVKLQPGHFYRVGINSPSYQNFRGVNGLPATPKAITFRTGGTAAAVTTPAIVTLSPMNGTNNVSATVTELRVTFNVPMGAGMSWCGSGPNFPTIPEGKRGHWIDGGKTCVLPVELKPNWQYEIGLNSRSFKNFQSEDGVALEPVLYTFKTGD